MARRNSLKSIIVEAWKDCIELDYLRQRINSERSLQASFWSQLNNKLPDSRRIFIEPPMKIITEDGIKQRFPDIVICNKREVTSIIELKYLPRAKPRFKKDIESLALISRQRSQISVSNSRFRGQVSDDTEYTLSKNILFVWAGVHSEPKSEINSLFSHGYKALDDCFIQLHAETRQDDVPIIYTLE